MEEHENHTITYISEFTHFSVKEMRNIPWDIFPKNAEVQFLTGRRAGERYGGRNDMRYLTSRNAQIIVRLA